MALRTLNPPWRWRSEPSFPIDVRTTLHLPPRRSVLPPATFAVGASASRQITASNGGVWDPVVGGEARNGVRKSVDLATLGNLCVDIVLGVPSLPPASKKERRAYMERLAASPPDKVGRNQSHSFTFCQFFSFLYWIYSFFLRTKEASFWLCILRDRSLWYSRKKIREGSTLTDTVIRLWYYPEILWRSLYYNCSCFWKHLSNTRNLFWWYINFVTVLKFSWCFIIKQSRSDVYNYAHFSCISQC